MIPLLLHRRFASRKAWSDASYPVSLNLHSWVILPTHGPLQQAIFFVVNAKHGRGCMLHTDGHVALSLCLRRVVGPSLVPTSLRCNRIQCRATSSEHACSEHACSEHACSEHACFYFIYFERPPVVLLLLLFGRTVQFATDRLEPHRTKNKSRSIIEHERFDILLLL